MLAVAFQDRDKKLIGQILTICRRVAESSKITAVCVYSHGGFGSRDSKAPVEILLVVYGFQPRLMNYMSTIDGRNVFILAVDQWVFERDVDRGFLGEALAWILIFPTIPLINDEYLHEQEVELKKRLVTEMLENLVLDFPELSYEFFIKPEYFMYEVVVRRARLFPPMTYRFWNFMQKNGGERSASQMLRGYLEALMPLAENGLIRFSDGYIRMTEKFIASIHNQRTRLVNLSKTVPRTLFTSLLSVLPKVLDILSQNRESLVSFQRILERSEMRFQAEVPENYLYVPTASGLVPLANKMGIEEFARKVLATDKNAKISVEALGGILNDVYLIRTLMDGKEQKVVVKRFKDWSSFKWFPLTLWSIGTRTFAVLGRSRLERECATNQLLYSKGFSVPKLLHVSADKRLVFMEYIEGKNASTVIKQFASRKSSVKTKKELTIIARIGWKIAKVHTLGIALGDTKPENIMIGKHGEIYLMDFEQSSRGGDKVWDIAEFLYYAGHDLPPFVETQRIALIAEAFVDGYLRAGGKTDVVRKAASPKYTKVFSIFTLPHVMLTISNVCRRTENVRE